MNEIERPAFVYARHNRRWRPAAKCYAPLQSLANLQIRLTIDAQDALDVHVPSIASNQYGEASEPEASPLRS
jgi:hypothetical protein